MICFLEKPLEKSLNGFITFWDCDLPTCRFDYVFCLLIFGRITHGHFFLFSLPFCTVTSKSFISQRFCSVDTARASFIMAIFPVDGASL